jgi:hypothetical protein
MHDNILVVFTGILAVAVFLQTLLFFGMFRAIRRMTVLIDVMGKDLLRNVEIVSTKVDESLAAIRVVVEGMKPIQDKLTVTAEVISNRIAEIDIFLAETTAKARGEVLRIQDTVKSVTAKVEEIFEILHSSVFAPLNQVGAITRAVRVGLDVLFRRRRSNSESARDEEMYI